MTAAAHDTRDGDFFALLSLGGGAIGALLLVVAIVLWIVAAANSVDCSGRPCPLGQKARLLDCVTPALEVLK